MGDGWTKGIHPDDLQCWLDAYLTAFELRQNFNVEYRILHDSGQYRWIESQASPRYDAAGSFIGYISQCLDVSERKAAESELKVAAIVFESQAGMFVADSNRAILRVNHAFTLITGYSAEDVVGKNPYMLNSGVQDSAFYASIWQVVNSAGVWEGELVSRRKNGEIYPEYITISAVFDPNGRVVNYVATLNDISVTKIREQQRMDRERELHNALVREVHHRIKNNLHGVMGILRRFSRRHKELASPINEALGQIQSIAVIHGLQGTDSSRNVRLCELVKEIVVSQKALWQASIKVDIPKKWPPCWIDESEAVPVALVLNELISNAVKHGNPVNGVSVVLAGNAELGKVLITITNTGKLSLDISSPNLPVKGTGLRLVSSLMPEDGATLTWEQHGGKVITQLELTSPIVSSEKEVF
jgi:PAS domain S-box-containing protein